MGQVIDVSERGEDAAVLTDTGSGGLFGGRLLHDGPLQAKLDDLERPRYVLHNKSEGVEIARAGETEQVSPDGDFRALVAVTDVRVHFVVGQTNGDRAFAVPLADVVDVGTDEGLVASTLWVATEKARYEFSCRGDLAPVAERTDGLAQATVRAYRLLDEARDALDEADDHLAADEFEAALDAVDAGDEKLRTARERLDRVGDGALAAFDEDNADARRRVRDKPRTIYGVYAWTTHSAARSFWADGEYGQAYDRYETALDAYENARQCRGETPTDEELSEQLSQAGAELDELTQAPLADARQVAHGAASIDGPAPAAEQWETAIRRYQDVLWLDWGRDERRFEGDPDDVRETIVDAVDNLVMERRAAARACRDAAQAHLERDAADAARAAHKTALVHVERAQSLVDEIAPNRETGLDDTRAAIEDELASVAGSGRDEDVQPGRDSGGDATGAVEDGTGDAAEMASPATSDVGTGDVGSEVPAADGEVPTSLVAAYWERHGWTVERAGGDLIATTTPIKLQAFVRVADAHTELTPGAVQDCADMGRFVDADVAVLVTGREPGASVRRRAEEYDVRLQDLDGLREETGRTPGKTGSA